MEPHGLYCFVSESFISLSDAASVYCVLFAVIHVWAHYSACSLFSVAENLGYFQLFKNYYTQGYFETLKYIIQYPHMQIDVSLDS